MTTSDFEYICSFVHDKAAIILEPGKEYLVESRLSMLARKENLASVDDLMRQFRANPNNGLSRKIIDSMTTNETSFFRDLHPFEALRKSILPDLIVRRSQDRQLNFWCGAASTGQEPYSVLMLLEEHFPEVSQWDFNFVATDICSDVLARARSGRFNQFEVNRGLPASFLVKYFVRQDAEWVIRDDFRLRVNFREMNLAHAWVPFQPLDIVFLRNVLIYFNVEMKKMILGKIRQLLRPGGYLLLGGAETTFGLDDGFERIVFGKTTFYQLKPKLGSRPPQTTSSSEQLSIANCVTSGLCL